LQILTVIDSAVRFSVPQIQVTLHFSRVVGTFVISRLHFSFLNIGIGSCVTR